MKIVRGILKIFLWVVVSLTGLLLLLGILIYVPPVQNFIKTQAAKIVSEKTGMELTVASFRLRFPLKLTIDDAMLVTPAGDTLARVGHLGAGVALAPLLRGEVAVNRIVLEHAAMDYRDTVADLRLKGTLSSLELSGTKALLKGQIADIGSAALDGADISLFIGEGRTKPDTISDTTAVAWKFSLASLSLSDIGFRMETSPQVTKLDARLIKGLLDSISVDLGTQQVTASLLRIDSISGSFLTDTTTVLKTTDATIASKQQTIPSTAGIEPASLTDTSRINGEPWTVRLSRLELNNGSFDYGSLYGLPTPGFDPSHIETSDIDLRIDSVYNRGTEVSAKILSLSLIERSGLRITDAYGVFSMDSSAMTLNGFRLTTPDSRIDAQALLSDAAMRMSPDGVVEATIDAYIGASDAKLLLPLSPELDKALAGKPLTLVGDFSGTLGNLDIGTFRAQLAQNVDLKLHGTLRSVTDPSKLGGNIAVSGKFSNIGFVKDFIADTALRNRIGIPRTMTLNGRIVASGGVYSPDLTLTADTGKLTVKGTLNQRKESYDATLALTDFPIYKFLPRDSLGSATLALTAQGQGFDPTADGAHTRIDLGIANFGYKRYDFKELSARAVLENHLYNVDIESADTSLELSLAASGEIRKNYVTAALHGAVARADLYAAGFAATPMTLSLRLDGDAMANSADSIYKVNLVIDSLVMGSGNRIDSIGRTTIALTADTSSVQASVNSGDLAMNFTSPESIGRIAGGFSEVSTVVKRQIDSLNLNMEALQEVMPAFKLDITAMRKNPLRNFLLAKGFDFNQFSVTAGSGKNKPFGAGVVINGFRTGSLTLDSLNVWALRNGDKLGFAARVRNRPGNIDQVAFIAIGGEIKGNSIATRFEQRDRADSVGFRFGIDAWLLDSAVKASFIPLNPIFGYRNWTINEGNFLKYYFDKRIEADLQINGVGNNQFLRITSLTDQKMPPGSVQVDIAGINLAEIFSLFPAPIPIEGILNAHGAVGLSGPIFKGNLKLGIDGLNYNEEIVGDVALEADANTDEKNIWNLDLDLTVNGKPTIDASGSYDVAGTGALDLQLSVPGLPLALVNPFLPADIARLSGIMNANLKLDGNIADPRLNGGISFENTRLNVPMIGTSFGVSGEKITVDNNLVTLRNFGLTAPNNQTLSLNGNLDMRKLSDIKTDIRLSGTNFEAVNSTRSGGSQVYGRLVLDVDVTARGPFSALVVRGNVNILNRTDIYYTMRNSPLEIEDVKQDIVTFVSFDEQDMWGGVDSIPLRRRNILDVLVNADIADNVKATVNLSEDGNNRIELVGDGALTYTMNNQGDMRLTGRYNISGGTVVYNPPVIAQKIFDIDDGSYVNWNGELANPFFNISATETVPVKVTKEDNVARTVNFNVIVKINNSLDNMAITFDLAAQNDASIQSALQNLTAEQRSSQAMYMLITNSYNGPGATTQQGGVDINQQLGDLISRELNQWARNNLNGVDISVGVGSGNDKNGGTSTDYSYSVSKSLFDNRVKVTIGGSVSDGATSGSMTENLIDDISVEYRLTKRDNMFLKVYRYNTQETILEGEITETGGGFVLRKKMNRIRELFRLTRDPQRKLEREKAREIRRETRDAETQSDKDPARQQKQDKETVPAGKLTSQPQGSIPTATGTAVVNGERQSGSQTTAASSGSNTSNTENTGNALQTTPASSSANTGNNTDNTRDQTGTDNKAAIAAETTDAKPQSDLPESDDKFPPGDQLSPLTIKD